ncbi:E3 ubiquitin-protein ligase orthrus, partial [Thalictrum thalictroides]
MAQVSNLPCDGEGVCMLCKTKPLPEETITCKTCTTPWHVACLSSLPETLLDTMEWNCPDCCSIYAVGEPSTSTNIVSDGQSDNLIAAIRAIEADESLTEQQKDKKRQLLMNKGKGVADLDAQLYCVICIMLPERPIT